MRQRTQAVMLVTVALLFAPHVAAQGAPDFTGKKVSVYISTGPGGGYDALGRLVGRAMSRHLAGNPTVVAENMPGAGGRRLANYIYNAAPKDGSAIAIVHHGTVYDALFEEQGVRYDPRKFNWLGSIASFTSVGIAWHTSGVKTIEDAKKMEIVMGSSGASSTSYQWTHLLNHMVGTRFKIVTGYKGAADMYAALEREELQGVAGTDWTTIRNRYGRWLTNRQVSIFVQFATEKHPDLPDVPRIGDLVSSEEDKRTLHFVFVGLRFARPFLAPPDLPAATAAALRTAFDAASKDPQLLAEAKKMRFDIDPVDGAAVERIIGDLYATPQTLVRRAQQALTGK